MTTLKFSAAEWSARPGSDEPTVFYRKLVEMGYEALEMPSGDPALAVAAGLKLLNFGGPGFSDGFCNHANHAGLIPQVQKSIEEAKTKGFFQVILFSGDSKGIDEATGLANTIEGIKACAGIAEKLGITIIFEMLNPFDHPGYMAVSSRFGFDVVAGVGSPNVKVLYDVYHMHRMKEDIIADLSSHGDLIAHLHIAGSPKRNFPGAEQEIDYRAVVKAALKGGYKGYWGMEFRPEGDYYAEHAAALKLFTSYC